MSFSHIFFSHVTLLSFGWLDGCCQWRCYWWSIFILHIWVLIFSITPLFCLYLFEFIYLRNQIIGHKLLNLCSLFCFICLIVLFNVYLLSCIGAIHLNYVVKLVRARVFFSSSSFCFFISRSQRMQKCNRLNSHWPVMALLPIIANRHGSGTNDGCCGIYQHQY